LVFLFHLNQQVVALKSKMQYIYKYINIYIYIYVSIYIYIRVLYIGKYQPMSFGGKNMKRRREKGGNIKEKGRKGKENEKRGSKRVK
jgi:hypothetical protein